LCFCNVFNFNHIFLWVFISCNICRFCFLQHLVSSSYFATFVVACSFVQQLMWFVFILCKIWVFHHASPALHHRALHCEYSFVSICVHHFIMQCSRLSFPPLNMCHLFIGFQSVNHHHKLLDSWIDNNNHVKYFFREFILCRHKCCVFKTHTKHMQINRMKFFHPTYKILHSTYACFIHVLDTWDLCLHSTNPWKNKLCKTTISKSRLKFFVMISHYNFWDVLPFCY
jgi:hypothetical protein